jgi:hypothetical protein
MTRQLVIIGTAVMTTLLALVALWQFRIVVIYVLISLVLAVTIPPIARSESRRNLVTRLLWDNPMLTLVTLLALADAFGMSGIILAPPLSVVCQILWNLLTSDRLAPDTSVQVSDLKERQARLRLTIEEMVGPPPPLVFSSMERLAGLLEKAEPVLQKALPPAPPDLFHAS